MELTVGTITEGKVKSITKFGAFIQLSEQQVGMVHISEIASSYVSDIREHLTEGQMVTVKVLSIENGKISLSMKKAQEPPKPARPQRPAAPAPKPSAPATFEEKLKQFMSDSDSKIAGCRQYEHRTRSRKR